MIKILYILFLYNGWYSLGVLKFVSSEYDNFIFWGSNDGRVLKLKHDLERIFPKGNWLINIYLIDSLLVTHDSAPSRRRGWTRKTKRLNETLLQDVARSWFRFVRWATRTLQVTRQTWIRFAWTLFCKDIRAKILCRGPYCPFFCSLSQDLLFF